MIGRKKEIEKIKRLLTSSRSEFLAVTGRRRVGKTYLVDSILQEHYCFSLTGIQNGSLSAQLTNFAVKLGEYDGSFLNKAPENWQMAFLRLKMYLKSLDKNRKHVIFLDELPWVSTPKSGFIQMLAHFWNDYLSKEKNFVLIVCGSATSWITQKIINDVGGLHNRVTENIHLYPFSLAETNSFLIKKGFQYTIQEVTKIYLMLGGIPFYLENLRKGDSLAMSIERLCFSPTGILRNEYNNLFQALFNNATLHQQITAMLANHPYGLTHHELQQKIGLEQSTGSYQRAMTELIISDFVVENTSFGKKKKGAIYRLIDEYSVFYHRFLKENKKYTTGIWQQMSESQSYKIWVGFAFESLCHKHIDEIKKALGISAVFAEVYSFSVVGNNENEGIQIDLLIDRKDDCINLCEIKFHGSQYTISKDDYNYLLKKKQRFIEITGTKKQVFLTFITNHGVSENIYSREIVDAEVHLDQLIE
jgi:uncharacterized protein